MLECVPITIAPPLDFVAQSIPCTDPIVWHVPKSDAKQLANTLSEIGLDQSTRDKLVAIAEVSSTAHGVFLHPSRELILGLSAEARGKLYAFLSGFPQNKDQVNAFRFAGESVDEWIPQGSLPPEVDKLVRRLLYRHGRFLFFADLRAIERDIPSVEVRTRLVQTLAREKTFLAKLKISRASSVEKLVSYWGRGRRAEDIRPILESLTELEGEQTLDIIHLLPPFARCHVYTYPKPESTGEAGKRDCHWTTFNFFSEQPDDRFCQPEEVLRTLERDYHRIDTTPQFGDVVIFVVNGSEAIHTAVYLADDIIFSKNGSSSAHPWMLMKLDHLRDCFPSRQPVEIRFLRRSR